jgi:predicted transcriptional regulator
MKTIEIKNNIKNKINLINDKSFLEAINNIIENKAEEKIYKLSDEQLLMVNEGEKEIEAGNFITNEDLDLEIKQWLKKS